MKLLALTGKRQVGKSRLARTLVTNLERRRVKTTQVGFSVPIHLMAAAALRFAGYDEATIERLCTGDLRDTHVIEEFGCTMREFQQKIGTDFGRDMVHNDLWVRLWAAHCRQHVPVRNVILQDSLRFDNEAEEIRTLGGLIVHIQLPDGAPYQGDRHDRHVSEKGITLAEGDVVLTLNHGWSERAYLNAVVKPLADALHFDLTPPALVAHANMEAVRVGIDTPFALFQNGAEHESN